MLGQNFGPGAIKAWAALIVSAVVQGVALYAQDGTLDPGWQEGATTALTAFAVWLLANKGKTS